MSILPPVAGERLNRANEWLWERLRFRHDVLLIVFAQTTTIIRLVRLACADYNKVSRSYCQTVPLPIALNSPYSRRA